MIRICVLGMVLATTATADSTRPSFLQAVGGEFTLQDQTGAIRTQVDPEGAAQVLFFGYANCQQICSSVLPQMADVVDILALDGRQVRPVMITVDPNIDTIATLGPAMEKIHADFIGLTGTPTALQVAYDAFQIEKEHLFDDPEYGPIYAHGSFLYLLDGAGEVLTIIPPILSDAEIVSIISNYIPTS